MDNRKPDPESKVSVTMQLNLVGGRPSNMSAEEHVTSIICTVVNAAISQTISFLDGDPSLTGFKDQLQLRRSMMAGALIAASEQVCSAWKFSGQKPEELPGYMRMMYALFEETVGSQDPDSTPLRPNVRDVGHA